MKTVLLTLLMIISLLIIRSDLASKTIPNRGSLCFAFFATIERNLTGRPVLFMSALLIFMTFYLLSRLSSLHPQMAFGAGDAKLIGGIALWLGEEALFAVTAAFLLAFLPALILLLARRSKKTSTLDLPFGPFLLVSSWLFRFR